MSNHLPSGDYSSAALEPAIADSWAGLRQLTAARIALGRAGVSLPSRRQLEFQQAHALARDAVHHGLDVDRVKAGVEALGELVMTVHSAANDRRTYLQRPDLGRRLNTNSRRGLEEYHQQNINNDAAPDLVLVVADGLSAMAIENNAVRFLSVLLPRLRLLAISVAPIVIAEQARVALGDEVGELLRARMVAILIGERPGLSSPDSMGIYISWQPRVGLQDSARNCLSNIRPLGMSDELAAEKMIYLMTEAFRRRLTGVALKDETVSQHVVAGGADRPFLL